MSSQSTNVADGRMERQIDGRTTYHDNTALRYVSRGKNYWIDCVGEWNKLQRWAVDPTDWRRLASTLVNNPWRWRVSRWLRQSSRSTVSQWTSRRARPVRHKLSSPAVAAAQTSLQRTHISAVRCAQQQWAKVAAWCDITVESALGEETYEIELGSRHVTRSHCSLFWMTKLAKFKHSQNFINIKLTSSS